MRPIIAFEGTGDLHVFTSVADAEAYLEPPDVLQSEYEIWDATGEVMVAEVVQPNRLLGHETVRLVATGRKEAEQLCVRIRQYLQRLNVTTTGQQLEELVPALLRIEGQA